jgi:PAS domain S-box-containing protein
VLSAVLNPDSYIFTVWALPPLLTGVVILCLGVLVAVLERFSRVSRFFLLYTVALVLWQFCNLLTFSATTEAVALVWSRIGQMGVFLIYPSVFHFGSVIGKTEKQDQIYILMAWLSAMAIVVISISTDWLVRGVYDFWWGYYPDYGWFGLIAVSIFAGFLSAAIYRMVRLHDRAEHGSIQWRRARLFALAYIIGVLAVVDFVSTAGFELYPVGYLPILFHWVAITYVTLRYRLVDITPEIAAQQIVDTMTDALIVLDMEKKVRLVNPAAEQLFAINETDVVGRPLAVALQDDVAAGYMQAMLTDTNVSRFQLDYHPASDGSRTLEFSAAIVKDNTRNPVAYVCILRDVTEQREMQFELERRVAERTAELAVARDHALEASRTKSAFLANMSHELRTPLNAIIGYSELLQEDAEGNNDRKVVDDLYKIRKAGSHLLNLVSMVLDLSKIEAGKMELYIDSFSIEPMVSEVVDTFHPIAAKNNNLLSLKCPKNIGDMTSDLTKIRQALMNLLSNACKFTHDGEIEFKVKREQRDDHDVIVFTVADNGIGMTLDQQQKLFSDFSQADSGTAVKYGGTGLGLAISRRFCQMLGGDIRVDSVAGEGSIFTMTIPATSDEEPAVNQAPADSP